MTVTTSCMEVALETPPGRQTAGKPGVAGTLAGAGELVTVA
jgi:hypothetical protein